VTDENSTDPDQSNLVEQVEFALAGAIFAVGISVAVLISNFGQEFKELTEAKQQVKVHHDILRDHQPVLAQNEAVLREHQAALAVHRSRAPSSQ